MDPLRSTAMMTRLSCVTATAAAGVEESAKGANMDTWAKPPMPVTLSKPAVLAAAMSCVSAKKAKALTRSSMGSRLTSLLGPKA
jgi:hypothetical protein